MSAAEQDTRSRQASATPGGATSPPSGEARLRHRGSRLAWPIAIGALGLFALALRLIGIKTGLPYVYNADENSHFVPRAIGMFGHNLNPDYFVNPPAYTYVVHALYAIKWGSDPAT